MKKVTVSKGKYPQIFGGIGLHNTEALLYPITKKEHFNQILCKCYREMPIYGCYYSYELLDDNFFDMDAGTRRIRVLRGTPSLPTVRSVYDIR